LERGGAYLDWTQRRGEEGRRWGSREEAAALWQKWRGCCDKEGKVHQPLDYLVNICGDARDEETRKNNVCKYFC
jgi:hypothetical protein